MGHGIGFCLHSCVVARRTIFRNRSAHWHDPANSFECPFSSRFQLIIVICVRCNCASWPRSHWVVFIWPQPRYIFPANEFVIESLKCNQNLIYVVRFCSWPPECLFPKWLLRSHSSIAPLCASFAYYYYFFSPFSGPSVIITHTVGRWGSNESTDWWHQTDEKRNLISTFRRFNTRSWTGSKERKGMKRTNTNRTPK